MTDKDTTISYYDVLGVRSNASQETIHAAFHQMAKKLHPDAGGSAEEMILLNKAYEILNDPDERKRYDNSLEKDTVPKTNQPTIEQLINQEKALVFKVRKNGAKTFSIGTGLLIAGLIITYTAYTTVTIQGAYVFAAGPIVVGLILFIKGLFRILSPYSVLHKIFNSKGYKHKFFLERPQQTKVAAIVIGICVIFILFVMKVMVELAKATS